MAINVDNFMRAITSPLFVLSIFIAIFLVSTSTEEVIVNFLKSIFTHWETSKFLTFIINHVHDFLALTMFIPIFFVISNSVRIVLIPFVVIFLFLSPAAPYWVYLTEASLLVIFTQVTDPYVRIGIVLLTIILYLADIIMHSSGATLTTLPDGSTNDLFVARSDLYGMPSSFKATARILPACPSGKARIGGVCT